MRSTKIVATIGPASREPAILEEMIRAGVDVCRLNFAHGNLEEHRAMIGVIRAAAERCGREVAVLQDVPGPKLRLGAIAGGMTELTTGSALVLTEEEVEGDETRLAVAFKGIDELLGIGDVAYLADGAIRLRVKEVRPGEVETEVEVGGHVVSRQGMNLPNVTVSLPAVSEADLEMIRAGVEMGVDAIALSFVRRKEDLDPVRKVLRDLGSDIPLIAKIEKPQAAANAEEVIEAADGLMVARGDLGIELPVEQVPLVQKKLLTVAGRKARPAITATHMLESMVSSTRPTRAEVTDVANAIFDGTDAVMLSQETAIGKHPVKAVEMMAAIAEATERELPYGRWLVERVETRDDDEATIAYGAVGAIYSLGLKALVCPTYSGRTARMISARRPEAPVLALSPRVQVVRRCNLYWGVVPRLRDEAERTTEDLMAASVDEAVEAGLAAWGDKIGITAGLPMGRVGGTNPFKVHTIA
ncbi:MAG: pyruvate kinase [Thermoleophilaceae bacterium]|nr:pyruvate kinase [Thermoleophilaceae bacterium]